MAAHTTSCSEVSSGGVTISLCRGGTARRSHLPPGQARSAPLRRLPQPSADPPTDSAGHGRTPTPTRSRTTPATAAPPRTTPCRPFNRRTSRRCRSPGAGTPGRQVPYPACRGSASAAGTHMGHRSPMHTALPMGEWRSDDIGTWPGSRRTAWISRAVGESWREGHRGHHRSDRVTSGRPRRVPRRSPAERIRSSSSTGPAASNRRCRWCSSTPASTTPKPTTTSPNSPTPGGWTCTASPPTHHCCRCSPTPACGTTPHSPTVRPRRWWICTRR